MSTTARGRAYEDLAAGHLRDHGYRIEDRNVIAGGVELDVIARSPDCPGGAPLFVFVEVRARTRSDRGHPFETIDRTKQQRTIRGATAWLCDRGLWERVDVRFDVIAILDIDGHTTVEHLEDAFETA